MLHWFTQPTLKESLIVARFLRVSTVLLNGLHWISNVRLFHSAAFQEREELDVEMLTFEKFIRLYNKICPRSEVQELFVKL